MKHWQRRCYNCGRQGFCKTFKAINVLGHLCKDWCDWGILAIFEEIEL